MSTWGILGCGTIANEMAATFQKMGHEIYGVANRTPEKAEKFADKYGVKHVFETYEEMLADENIDIIYVATPHSMHYENMKQAVNVLLVDETKVTDKLNNKVPVVLDIIPEAVNYVTSQVEAMGATVKKRDEHLLEVYYDTLPELEEIDKNLKMITGVIETSLFYQVATKALVAGEEGIRVIK